MIRTDDLDAADDLERMIQDMINEAGSNERPTILFLKHRPVVEAKTFLESILGIDGGGGSGGGGLGGMLGGMVGNAIGGTAGNALGGLLGGGDDGSSDGGGGIELEGDVTIAIDVRFNSLVISGATSNDLDIIIELVDYVDQPGPPQDLNLLGETRVIPVIYRDPEELKSKIETQLSGYFRQATAPQGGAGGVDQAQQQIQRQMAQAMQQLGNAGKKNRGSQDPEQEKSVATLGVDLATSSLLVTGPEFIYYEVLKLVDRLDVPDRTPKKNTTVSISGTSRAALEQFLGVTFSPEKIEFVDATTESKPAGGGAPPPSGGSSGSTSPGSDRGSSTNQQQEQAQQRAAQFQSLINRIQGGAGAGGSPAMGAGGRGGGGGRGGFGGGRGGGGAPGGGGVPGGFNRGGGGGGR